MATATATGFKGTFRGRAEEVRRVRRELAAYLADCPVAADLVLIADELAANAVLHSRSRGEFFRVRCELSAESVQVEVEDMGGPWRTRRADDRPHGLDVVEALGAEWGTVTTADRTRVVWARLAVNHR
jgi:serine/threonine-protein kinase RsbW